ncbi:hypothetical protein BCV70DRAFT_201102 [Testicularia cyperi]|uniref:Endonuclease/exonuclease/phosphatase domain-containing protein n=1 Tax=Testicularia cyperi TaxID=1882483 RepID=A0A317XQH9_9BASI|nr:hypothetical protein BCV70DRAFT_201102 [Testicularia cyperi]
MPTLPIDRPAIGEASGFAASSASASASNGNSGSGSNHADKQLRILTFNVWGLKYISKLRVARIKAIAASLASASTPHYDFVCLQEIWYESKDWRFLKRAVAERYPHSKFFYSGAFGSGLAILSRWQIQETRTHPYSLNGQPIHVHHGDWFVGKACGCVTVNHPLLGLVDVWNTHFVAAGGEDGSEAQRSHRITQAYELAANCRNSATRARHVVCVGDLNSTPPSLSIALLRDVGGLYDSFLDTHTRLPPLAVALPPENYDQLGGDGGLPGSSSPLTSTLPGRPDPERAIAHLGVTCDSPLNTWTAGKNLDPRATRAAGKRLDYILYRGPALDHDPSTQLAYTASATTSRGRLAPSESNVVFTDKVPGLGCSYSDHFGLETTFDILDSPAAPCLPRGAGAGAGISRSNHASTTTATSDSAVANSNHSHTLRSAAHALAGGHVRARSTQTSHFYLFALALVLALALLVASIFQPLGAVNPVFILLAVVAGWAGTTMLYSALVWGEWEKRTLRTVIEMIEMELDQVRTLAGKSPSSSASSATTRNHVNTDTQPTSSSVREGTLF